MIRVFWAVLFSFAFSVYANDTNVSTPVEGTTPPATEDAETDTGEEVLPLGVPVFRGPHSKCIEVNNQIIGDEIHHPARLASTSKLVTSYWALKTLGPNFRFTTRVGYNKTTKTLYIDSEGDPLFARKRIFHLISQLNQKGIRDIERVEFSRRTIFLVFVEDRPFRFIEVGPGDGPSQANMKDHVLPLFNTANWSNEIKDLYRSFARKARQRGISVIDNPQFSAESVRWTTFEKPTLWTSQSPPLIKYLKLLNRFSMNYIGDRLYHVMGGKYALEEFLHRDGDLNRDPFEFFTGSGLNIGQRFNRVDNAASCFFMIRLITKLRETLAENSLQDQDLFLVVGKEDGTLNPPSGSSWSGRVLAKTGTLRNAITLAGILKTRAGDLPFGIFFQTEDKAAGRAERNRQLDRWFRQYGVGRAVDYSPEDIFPIDSDMGMIKSLTELRNN